MKKLILITIVLSLVMLACSFTVNTESTQSPPEPTRRATQRPTDPPDDGYWIDGCDVTDTRTQNEIMEYMEYVTEITSLMSNESYNADMSFVSAVENELRNVYYPPCMTDIHIHLKNGIILWNDALTAFLIDGNFNKGESLTNDAISELEQSSEAMTNFVNQLP